MGREPSKRTRFGFVTFTADDDDDGMIRNADDFCRCKRMLPLLVAGTWVTVAFAFIVEDADHVAFVVEHFNDCSQSLLVTAWTFRL